MRRVSPLTGDASLRNPRTVPFAAAVIAFLHLLSLPVFSAEEPTPIGTTSVPLALQDVPRLSQYWGVDLSPDGAWLSYSFSEVSEETVVSRLRLEDLVRTRTLDPAPTSKRIGNPAWSPDSGRLAFYSDEGGGKIMLRVWDRVSQTSRVVDGAELPDLRRAQQPNALRWFPDNRHVLLSLWPEGMARPNKSADSRSPFRPPFAKVETGQASVYVHRANFDSPSPKLAPAAGKDDYGLTGCEIAPYGPCDLAIVDTIDGSIERIATGVRLGYFHQPSPNGRNVAYATFAWRDRATGLLAFDLHVLDVSTRRDRTIARDLANYSGGTFSWAPDGRSIASLSQRTAAGTEAVLSIVPIDGTSIRTLQNEGLPAFHSHLAPVWSEDERKLFLLTVDQRLWEFDTRSWKGRAVPALETRHIRTLVRAESEISGGSKSVLVTAVEDADVTPRLFRLDLNTGVLRQVFDRGTSDNVVGRPGRIDASRAGAIAFVSTGANSPGDLRLLPRIGENVLKIGDRNRFLEDVALGKPRKLTWRTADGKTLAGALSLPPTYEPGQKLPLFVWVYGGRLGSTYVDRFGFSDNTSFNAQVLSTRGYAVLYPDIPQRLGTPMQDIVTAVMPGVDAAIEQGFADPDRLAVGGHSYGSYTTLALITHTRRFKAAIVSGVGHPDLIAAYLKMHNDGASAERWAETGQGLLGGTPWEYPDRYRDNSPILLFDRITAPVLIQQGEVDGPTPLTGANAVFVALRRLGKPVEYRIYEGEGHGFKNPANIVDIWVRRLEFLAQSLDVAVDREGRIVLENGEAKRRSR